MQCPQAVALLCMPGNAVLSLHAHLISDTCNGSTSQMAPATATHLLQPFLIADFEGTSHVLYTSSSIVKHFCCKWECYLEPATAASMLASAHTDKHAAACADYCRPDTAAACHQQAAKRASCVCLASCLACKGAQGRLHSISCSATMLVGPHDITLVTCAG